MCSFKPDPNTSPPATPWHIDSVRLSHFGCRVMLWLDLITLLLFITQILTHNAEENEEWNLHPEMEPVTTPLLRLLIENCS